MRIGGTSSWCLPDLSHPSSSAVGRGRAGGGLACRRRVRTPERRQCWRTGATASAPRGRAIGSSALDPSPSGLRHWRRAVRHGTAPGRSSPPGQHADPAAPGQQLAPPGHGGEQLGRQQGSRSKQALNRTPGAAPRAGSALESRSSLAHRLEVLGHRRVAMNSRRSRPRRAATARQRVCNGLPTEAEVVGGEGQTHCEMPSRSASRRRSSSQRCGDTYRPGCSRPPGEQVVWKASRRIVSGSRTRRGATGGPSPARRPA